MSAPLEWIVVGGGLHGVHMGVVLVGGAPLPAERIAIVDPGAELLERWNQVTRNTGMPFLRSPGVHHLDLDPWSLHRFAGATAGRGRSPDFRPPYDRPRTGLFFDHCASLVRKYALAERHHRARAMSVDLRDHEVVVRLDNGATLAAKRAVLALGMSDQPYWPGWALTLASAGAPVQHVFQPGFTLDPTAAAGDAVVVGAGISGVQVALRLSRAGCRLTLVSRHAIREHPFDSDPGWVGPRYMDGFERETCMARRRALIVAARHRGSLPADVHRALRHAIETGAVRWASGEVDAADVVGGCVRLRVGESTLTAEQVLLATGYARFRPGGALVDELVERHGLPCAPCGFPVVDRTLRWHPRLHVTGPLAELEIGPTSRNITGARRAGERILGVARQASGGKRPLAPSIFRGPRGAG